MDKEAINSEIREKAVSIADAAGRERLVIKDESVGELAELHALTVREIYLAALALDICPYRYIRNGEAISTAEQLKLAESHVAVVGAGGLGGQVIVLLARIGIGALTVVDRDRFDETNLNRQSLCRQGSLGRLKAHEAASVVAAVNPAVAVFPHAVRLDERNIDAIVKDCHVMVDALDNIPDRLMMEKAAKRRDIPLVHGAVAGFKGQWMVIGGDDEGFQTLFADDPDMRSDRRSPENLLGVPSIAPAVV
ncbi:MAG: ThiF family adenylyltransferase, partial [Deltaproteobacteria bacterium]|nr:ThiF family adenylyltransferase [Deltaproteobacteria bacterium]